MILNFIKLIIVIIFIFKSSLAFAIQKEPISNAEATIERILSFSYDLLSKKSEHFNNNVMPYNNWLKNRPKTDYEKLFRYYENHIFKIFSNQEYFNYIIQAVFNGKNLDGVNMLSDEDKAWIMTLLIKHYSMTHVIDDIKPDNSINEVFSDYFLSGPKTMRLYQRSQNDILLLWCIGRGAHNNEYMIFALHLEQGRLYVKLLQIPIFYSEGNIKKESSITASGSSYDSKNDILVMNISSGDINGWEGVQSIYKIHKDALSLIRQRMTKEYSVMNPGIDNYFDIGWNDGNQDCWIDEYVNKNK